jgi:hypothetical protein
MNDVKEIWHSLGTAWSGLSEQDRSKMEGMWGLIVDSANRVYNKVLQRENNFYLLTAPPYFVDSKKYCKLYSNTANSLEQLGLTSLQYQVLPENLIYADKLTIEYDKDGKSVQEDILYNDTILTQSENSVTGPKASSIYYFSNTGSVELTEQNRLWNLVNEVVG